MVQTAGMSKDIHVVGISRSVNVDVPDEETIFSALVDHTGLDISAGMLVHSLPLTVRDNTESSLYAAYSVTAKHHGSIDQLRSELLVAGDAVNMDFAVVPWAILEANKLLVVLDVDSTLIAQEVIDELAVYAGQSARVASITDAAMRGELDFEQSLRERVGVLQGQPEAIVNQVASNVQFTEGARELVRALHENGHVVAAVSGGFIQVLRPLAAELDLDYARANLLEIEHGFLTGEVKGEIITAEQKRAALREWAHAEGISMTHTVAIGDGANDVLMVQEAGLGVAFNAKPALRDAAKVQINVPRLDAVRHFLGL
ncbi:MAG: phosphoserine phosphatase SerB [Rothia sp. (in: high G+C Gram-positive bacteria)]|nr:phosphoserine phosphatase SerB [Rothia sp. (in: high G+C Gram-positive bacteria)]